MFRNKELRRFALLLAVIAVIFAAASFALDRTSGFLLLAFAAAFCTAFFAFTRARYHSLAQLAGQIDMVLHHEDHLMIADLNEGELSILQSEITKMTLRIREQNDALKKEKDHLAQSLADIAHQLRTPLTSANLILTLLAQSTDEKERRTLVRENQELFAQMDWLVHSLLKLSRLDAGMVEFQIQQMEVEALLASAIRPLAIPLELHRIALHLQVPQGAVLQGDFGWLSEVMQNLLKNSMENAGDQGAIAITCEDNPLFTQISLHDSGPGFQTEELPHLFDRYYRGKQTAASGYGIGLALCKSVITRQGGTIAAKNHPQGGALFLIRFPK